MQMVNSVVIAGNLTRDPELRTTGSGMAICSMRIANNRRRKNSGSGEWEDSPNYFDVTVFGKQGENCSRYLSRGRGVLVKGELRWREWEKDGVKRQAVEIVADETQFLSSPDRDGDGGRSGYSMGGGSSDGDRAASTDGGSGYRMDTAPVTPAEDDDIPF